MDYICKQSPLIEVFRSCHVMVESAFQLTHRTLKHTPPDMTATIERLRAYMESSGMCKFQRGRAVERETVDNITRGLHVILTKKTIQRVTQEAGEISQVAEAGEISRGDEDVEGDACELSAADLEAH